MTRPSFFSCVAGIGLLMLAGCATTSADISPATPTPPPPKPTEEAPPKLEKRIIRADSRKLAGLGPVVVQNLLGVPDLLRRDGNVQIALYEQPSCILDLTYFSAAPGTGFALTHVAARTPLGQRADADDCLTDILRNHERGTIPALLEMDEVQTSATDIPAGQAEPDLNTDDGPI